MASVIKNFAVGKGDLRIDIISIDDFYKNDNDNLWIYSGDNSITAREYSASNGNVQLILFSNVATEEELNQITIKKIKCNLTLRGIK